MYKFKRKFKDNTVLVHEKDGRKFYRAASFNEFADISLFKNGMVMSKLEVENQDFNVNIRFIRGTVTAPNSQVMFALQQSAQVINLDTNPNGHPVVVIVSEFENKIDDVAHTYYGFIYNYEDERHDIETTMLIEVQNVLNKTFKFAINRKR